MWFCSLFDALLARSSRTPAQPRRHAPRIRQRPRSFRPHLDVLEDRTVPSTLTVTNNLNTGVAGDGSLRGEIAAAQTGDTINFAASLAGQTITSGELAINKSLDIEGLGANKLTISGNSYFRVFDITASNVSVTLAGLTIANGGDVDFGGGIYNQGGTLVINNCTLSGNTSSDGGGAIYNDGTLTVSNSTLSGNTVIGTNAYGGGAIYMAAGKLSLSSSTLSNNLVDGGYYYYTDFDTGILNAFIASDAYGGGLYVAGGTVSIDHSTIAGNAASVYTSDPGYPPSTAWGGGISIGPYAALQVYDSILAGNTADFPDLYGGFTSLGHNLIGNAAGSSGFVATDVLNVDPQLAPLQNNGGPTQTMALLAGSRAIDAGDNTGAPAYDQRGPGFPRIVGGAIDIGAFEAQTAAAPQASSFTVSGFPASTTAGVAGSFTVTAKNADGTTATAYTGTVRFTSSDSQAGLPAAYTFTAADNGMHTFSATLKTAGTQSLTAKDLWWNTVTGTQSGIAVNPATASKFIISAPANSTAGSAFSVTVAALDTYNNAATDYTGTVHFTSTDGVATLAGNYTFTAADAGVHAFTGVILKTAGSQTVTATDTVTSLIAGSAAVAVNPAAASTMIVAGFPSTTTAGVGGNFTVTLKDLYGNIATSYTGTVHFASSDGKAALQANYTFTAADAGVHTFSATLKTAGTQSITATDTATASLTATKSGITVNPAAVVQFIISNSSNVSAGVPFSLTITVRDAYGNVVTGYTGTIHFSNTDHRATLPADYTFTAADNGVHTFTGLVLRTKGSQKITITDALNSSLTGSVIEHVV